MKQFRWWDLEIFQALARRSILALGFPLASDLIGIVALKSLKNSPLIVFSPSIRSSTPLVDQFHPLDLNLGPLGHNLLKLISQRPHGKQVFTRISKTRYLPYKSYPQTLALEIPLALSREPYTLLKQATHTIESLL